MLRQGLEQSPGRIQVTAGRAVLNETQYRLNISYKCLVSSPNLCHSCEEPPKGLNKEILSPCAHSNSKILKMKTQHLNHQECFHNI